MLIDIHVLQNHAPCNLNRDDTGSPKDCMFGGVRRSRISSQSIKRSIRTSDIFKEEMKSIPLGIRTALLPKEVRDRLIRDGINPRLADIASEKVIKLGKKPEKQNKAKKTDDEETVEEAIKETSDSDKKNKMQVMFLTSNDIDAVVKVMREEIDQSNGNPDKFKKMGIGNIVTILSGPRPITADIALFGRMITSKAFQNIDASMQVAHAISTNKMDHEFDYFTAVDDLKIKGEDDSGAGMIEDVQFNSACYYKFFSLDFDGFVNNLCGEDRSEKSLKEAKVVAVTTVRAFINAALKTTPSGKQNTFAAHQLPDAVLIEVRAKKVPVSYANAFVKPAASSMKKDLVEDSIEKFARYTEVINSKYDLQSKPRLWFTTGKEIINGTEICNTETELVNRLISVL